MELDLQLAAHLGFVVKAGHHPVALPPFVSRTAQEEGVVFL